MKFIHESLPAQGKPKWICRIWRDIELIFYKTFSFNKDNKEEQLLKAKAAVKDFLVSRDEEYLLDEDTTFVDFKRKPTKANKHEAVGVFRYAASKKNPPYFAANVTVNNEYYEICYSTVYFGEACAFNLAKKTALVLRKYFSFPKDVISTEEHMNVLKTFKKKKSANVRFRLPGKIYIGKCNVYEALLEFESYCNKNI